MIERIRLLMSAKRREILRYISLNPGTYVKHIYLDLGTEQAITSHHINLLLKAGYLVREKKGKNHEYSIAHENIERDLVEFSKTLK